MSFYEKVNIREEPLDLRSIRCLAMIVRETGAKIVLTSSWRGGWDKNPDLCDVEGKILNTFLAKEGLEIYDKTECMDICDGSARCKEIKKWLRDSPVNVDHFVIIDDADFNWKQNGLKNHWIRTDFMKEGLSEEHVEVCIHKLKERSFFSFFKHFFHFI